MDFGKRQIGNTVILKYKKGDLPFIMVSTVSGDFSVEYGAGSVMFMLTRAPFVPIASFIICTVISCPIFR